MPSADLSFDQEGKLSMVGKQRSITPEKAVEILRGHGTIVTVEEAKIILDFMYNFSKLAINQIVTNVKLKHEGDGKHKFSSL